MSSASWSYRASSDTAERWPTAVLAGSAEACPYPRSEDSCAASRACPSRRCRAGPAKPSDSRLDPGCSPASRILRLGHRLVQLRAHRAEMDSKRHPWRAKADGKVLVVAKRLVPRLAAAGGGGARERLGGSGPTDLER